MTNIMLYCFNFIIGLILIFLCYFFVCVGVCVCVVMHVNRELKNHDEVHDDDVC